MQKITVSELQALMAEGKVPYLVDVREQVEHDSFNIGGALLPLSELMTRVAEIPDTGPVVVYCRKGVRSQIAIQRLEAKFGFKNLYNLEGGIDKWNKP